MTCNFCSYEKSKLINFCEEYKDSIAQKRCKYYKISEKGSETICLWLRDDHCDCPSAQWESQDNLRCIPPGQYGVPINE